MGIFTRFGWIRRLRGVVFGVRRFMQAPWAGGVVLLTCVAIAMLLANLPATALYYHHLLETELSAMVHSPEGVIDWIFPRGMTVEKFINDGLMVVFFFSVGLEIKREIVCGRLSTRQQAILPVVAALGGMLAPALVFTLFNHGTAAANGWGIPTATDIAFAVGILSMVGDRVPVSLKIFLTALAIADDLGAILVIALFYGGEVRLGCLLAALAVMALVYGMKRLGEKRMGFYLVPAVIIWGLFYYSGVHSTLSGVAMAMLIPMEPRYGKEYFVRKMALPEGGFRVDCNLRGRFPRRGTAGLPAPCQAVVLPLGRDVLSAGGGAGSLCNLPHYADLCPGECRGRHRLARIFPDLHPFARDRVDRHGGLLRTGRGQAAGHIPCGVDLREDGAGRHARRGFVADAAGGGLPGRHRLHDVALRRFARILRCGAHRPRQDRHPDGFGSGRRVGYLINMDLR